jgi:hypothetical protein
MNYKPGTPEANVAKFTLPDKTKVDPKILYGRQFVWTPILSGRRIYDANTFSVQLEVGEAIIHDIFERVTQGVSVPMRTSRLVERISKEHPEQAAMIAVKYKQLLLDDKKEMETKSENSTGLKIDDVSEKTPQLKESEVNPDTISDFRRGKSVTPDKRPQEDEVSRTETSRRRPQLPPRK